MEAFVNIAMPFLLCITCTAVTAQTIRPVTIIADNVPEQIERIVQASADHFKSIRGAPMKGYDFQGKHTFRWRGKILLSGANSCDVLESELDDVMNRRHPRYVCQIPVSLNDEIAAKLYDDLVAATRAALGPAWIMSSESRLRKAFRDPGPDGYERVHVDCCVQLDKNRFVTLHVAPPYTPLDSSSSIASKISERTQTFPEATLTAHKSLNGMVQSEIVNKTEFSLSVTFVGPIEQTITVRPGSQSLVTLLPGLYRLRANVADASVAPYSGAHTYGADSQYTTIFDVR